MGLNILQIDSNLLALVVLRKIKVVFLSGLKSGRDSNPRGIRVLLLRRLKLKSEYVQIFYKYFTKNFISFESRHLYKATIILIYIIL